jgi:hypothetical protein
MTIATAAVVASSVLGFKGNMQASRAAKKVGDYNAQMAENERVLLLQRKSAEEAALRKNSRRLVSSQRTAISKGGVQITGSPYLALADAYFATEKDALKIQYAANVESTAKIAEAAMSRAAGRVKAAGYENAAYTSLLGGYSAMSRQQYQNDVFALQQEYYKKELGS